MKNKKKTTIKDIANVLGITPSAVSKALNDHPRISEKTKVAVRQVAENLNYRPNQLASALRKGRSNLVGVIVPRPKSNFFSSVIESMEEVLNKRGYNVVITQSNESYEKECKNIDALLQIQVDGIIASLANETTDFKYYEKIKKEGIPLILFDRADDDLEVDLVAIDDYKSSHMVVEHLIAQNCKRIAHIGGYRHTRIYRNRIRGYKDALELHKLPTDENLLMEGSLSLEDGREKMQALLKLPQRPDAVYAAGDYAALGAFQVLREHNIKVPEEIALVGFSNEPFTALMNPSISSVDQQSDAIGKLAANTFLNRIDAGKEKGDLIKVILEPELLVRDSSRKKM